MVDLFFFLERERIVTQFIVDVTGIVTGVKTQNASNVTLGPSVLYESKMTQVSQ